MSFESLDRVEVPAARRGEMIVARIELKKSLFREASAALLKPIKPAYIEVESEGRMARYRFVEATAEGPLVLCVPDGAGFDPRFERTECPRSLRLINVSAARISFDAIPLG